LLSSANIPAVWGTSRLVFWDQNEITKKDQFALILLWQPSPALIGTLENWRYMAELKMRMNEVLGKPDEEPALLEAA